MGADVTISSQNDTVWTFQQDPGNVDVYVRVAAFYATINMVCICFVAMCLMWLALRYFRKKEERDKLGEVIDQKFWKEESQIACLFKILNIMKESAVFRDITAYHILSYKYRTDNGVYAYEDSSSKTERTSNIDFIKFDDSSKVNAFAVLKKIERLLFTLCLQMPRSGHCSKHAAATIGSTILSIVQATSMVWCDEKAISIFRVVKYFSGKKSAEKLHQAHIKDVELETLVLSRIPYVTNLCLKDHYFILKEFSKEHMQASSSKIFELQQKISHIDRFLNQNYNKLESVRETIVSFYQQARELSFRNNLILTKAHFADLSTIRNGGLAGRFRECVTSLTHLLRLMSYGNNVKKFESDENFESLVGGFDKTITDLKSNIVQNMSAIEKTKENIVSFLQGLTPEQILTDKEFTKNKLELIEEELKSHIKSLTTQSEDIQILVPSTSTKVDEREEIHQEEQKRLITHVEKKKQKHSSGGKVKIKMETIEDVVVIDDEEPYSETPV